MNKTHSIPISTQICLRIDLVHFCPHRVSVLPVFQQLALQGITDDNSWVIPAQQYVEIYEVIRHK